MSFADQARQVTQYFIDKDCHTILFKTQEFGEFLNQGCASAAISKILGYFWVGGKWKPTISIFLVPDFRFPFPPLPKP